MPIIELAAPHSSAATNTTAAWWAVVSRFLLHGLIVSTWVSRISAIKSELGLSNAQFGMCLLGTAIGSVLAIPCTGFLVSRFGSRQVTAWSTLGFSITLAAPACAFSAATLFLALIAFGAMAGTNDVAINAQGVALEHTLGSSNMSRFHAMFSIGGMLGASVGALVAAREIPPARHLLIASVLFVVFSLFTAPFLFDAGDNRTAHHARARRTRIPSLLVVLALIGFCLFLSEGAIADWTGIYLKQNLNADAGMAAAGYALFSTGMALFRLLGDSVAMRLGPVLTVRLGAIVAALGMTLALVASSPLAALPGFALTGAGFSVIVPLVFAAGGRVATGSPGAGIATVSGLGYIGFLIGPPAIGLLAQQTSLRWALFVIVGLSLLAAVLAKAVGTQSSPPRTIAG